MIGYLRGQVLENQEGRLLLGLGAENAGCVGYLVQVPQGPSAVGLLPGKEAELFIHTHVREDAFELFGFPTRLEREIFLTLISVNGIGPRGALGILSNASVADVVDAILTGDKETLTKIPGVGKKTAERLVLELGDSLRKKMDSGVLAGASTKSVGAASTAGKPTGELGRATLALREAQDALVALGYREQEVAAALKRWSASRAELQGADLKNPVAVGTIVKEVLQELR